MVFVLMVNHAASYFMSWTGRRQVVQPAPMYDRASDGGMEPAKIVLLAHRGLVGLVLKVERRVPCLPGLTKELPIEGHRASSFETSRENLCDPT